MMGIGWAMMLAGSLAAAPSPEAERLLREGKADDAAVLLEESAKAAPGDVETLCLLGKARAWSGRLEDAEAAYLEALKSSPSDRDCLLGLARLRGYQGRWADAASVVEGGLRALPEDREFLAEKISVERGRRRARCDAACRRTVRAGLGYDAYSFAGASQGLSLFYRDRALYGWDASAAASYEHRFRLDDVGLALQGVRKLGRGAWGSVGAGAATRGTLLPVFMASAGGGLSAVGGFSVEGLGSFRRYKDADVWAVSPGLVWEGSGWLLSAGYAGSQARYDNGSLSGWLPAWRLRAVWAAGCPVRPWASWSRAREAFEAGAGRGAASFRSQRWAGGLSWRVRRGLDLEASSYYETRPELGQRVRGAGLGAAWSWGSLP